MREFKSTGMIEITVRKKTSRWWKQNKNGILYGSLIAPIALSLLFIDVFAKHPRVALAYLIGTGAWYTLFTFAQGIKKPRAATRGKETTHSKVKDFRAYLITEREELSNEEVSA